MTTGNARRQAGSGNEEVEVTAYSREGLAADPAQLAPGSLGRHSANLLRHGKRNLIQAGDIIRGDLYVMIEAATPGGERYRKEQPGYHHVATMRHHDNGAYSALLTTGDRVEVTKQDVTAGQELYSGYSSAAVAARSPRSTEVHSATSA